ncbi:MAG: CBS domain-containing protein [Microlunatus sp.]|nr:CBS domain-containing protein [Microlunatus sp.]MDN5771118.1 CBS domain-containing protein [Microlunatus sp.]
MRARDIMSTPAVCVLETTPLSEVAGTLAEHGFTAVPVVDQHDHLVGLVSEVDLIRERFELHPHPSAPGPDMSPRSVAGEVMTTPVEFVGPQTQLSVLARRMITGRRRSMPVVASDQVVGVVTRRDVVATMARSDEAILAEVRRRLGTIEGGEQWLVRVQSGVVHLRGKSDPRLQSNAIQAADSVSGVVRVTVTG